MIITRARCSTPRSRQWLARSSRARILHLFDNACNLINDREELLSLVLPPVGCGPFNLVLPLPAPFTRLLTLSAELAIREQVLQCGPLHIEVDMEQNWYPIPAWENWRLTGPLPARRQSSIAIRAAKKCAPLLQGNGAAKRSKLMAALAGKQVDKCAAAATDLAGLGPGLTPAGDDYLLGVLWGLWTMEWTEKEVLAAAIAAAAAERTNRLAAAWLHAGAAGEAGEAWHHLAAMIGAAGDEWEDAVQTILNTGHTSGADALLGFTDCRAWLGKNKKLPF